MLKACTYTYESYLLFQMKTEISPKISHYGANWHEARASANENCLMKQHHSMANDYTN